MLKKSILMAVCFLGIAGILLAEKQTIRLKGGGELTGEVSKTKDGYTVTLDSGGTLVVTDEQVEAVVDYVSPEQEYEKLKAQTKIDPENPHRTHYELASWAEGKGYHEIARRELQEALRLKPDYEIAKLLLKRVERRLKEAEKPTKGDEGDDAEGAKGTRDDLIGELDINRIRLTELRETDRVGIAFRDDVVAKFVEAYRGTDMFAEPGGERKFRAYSNLEKARYMLDMTKLEPPGFRNGIRDNIIIRGDPEFMSEFRGVIWPIVSQNCARRECHGGDKAVGGIRFFRATRSREQEDYTNFYILDSYEKGGLSMIDRSTPEKSLLLHYGLPDQLAQFSHPKPITAIFRDRSDRTFVRVEQWIRSLRYPRPDYGAQYKPPWASAAPQVPQPPVERGRPPVPEEPDAGPPPEG